MRNENVLHMSILLLTFKILSIQFCISNKVYDVRNEHQKASPLDSTLAFVEQSDFIYR
jgi:hypothetical protein